MQSKRVNRDAVTDVEIEHTIDRGTYYENRAGTGHTHLSLECGQTAIVVEKINRVVVCFEWH